MKALVNYSCLVFVCMITASCADLGADVNKGVATADAPNYATAIKEWKPLAEAGDFTAQYNLGLLYARGQGVPVDYTEAVRYFHLAAQERHAKSQLIIGNMYATGEGVKRDYAEARQWWRLAADQGEASALNNLGVLYKNGEGLEKDDSRAYELFSQAADQGDDRARVNLGIMMANGLGIAADNEQACKLFTLVASSATQPHETYAYEYKREPRRDGLFDYHSTTMYMIHLPGGYDAARPFRRKPLDHEAVADARRLYASFCEKHSIVTSLTTDGNIKFGPIY